MLAITTFKMRLVGILKMTLEGNEMLDLFVTCDENLIPYEWVRESKTRVP